jgi:hypothetical protein
MAGTTRKSSKTGLKIIRMDRYHAARDTHRIGDTTLVDKIEILEYKAFDKVIAKVKTGIRYGNVQNT